MRVVKLILTETDNILSNLSHLSVRKTAGMIDMVEEMEAYRKIIGKIFRMSVLRTAGIDNRRKWMNLWN